MRLYETIKRGTDIAGAAALALITSPASAAIAFLIKMESPGPVIFVHDRTGKAGIPIKVYKFRSMKTGSEDLEASLNDEQLEKYYLEYRLTPDPRTTLSGRILRRSCLDELPQLLNILKGEMSLVGPRPVTSDELSFYSDEEIRKLLSVKPGLTGYWQVFGRNTATYQNGKRQQMELYYADNASLLLDLHILLKTPAAVAKRILSGDL